MVSSIFPLSSTVGFTVNEQLKCHPWFVIFKLGFWYLFCNNSTYNNANGNIFLNKELNMRLWYPVGHIRRVCNHQNFWLLHFGVWKKGAKVFTLLGLISNEMHPNKLTKTGSLEAFHYNIIQWVLSWISIAIWVWSHPYWCSWLFQFPSVLSSTML